MDHYKTAKSLVAIMENRFTIGSFRFGLDPLVGIIPGIGDAVSAFLSMYIVWVANIYGVPKHRIKQMIGNVIIDLAMGTIPVIGDVSDVFFRSNSKNWKIIQEYLG